MSVMTKDLQYYLALPWSFSVERHADDGVYYVARVNELDCMTDAPAPDKAVKELEKALKAHLEACIEAGVDIPEPVKPEDFKGQIAYRTKPEKHYKIAREAQRRKTSINKLIDEAVDAMLTA